MVDVRPSNKTSNVCLYAYSYLLQLWSKLVPTQHPVFRIVEKWGVDKENVWFWNFKKVFLEGVNFFSIRTEIQYVLKFNLLARKTIRSGKSSSTTLCCRCGAWQRRGNTTISACRCARAKSSAWLACSAPAPRNWSGRSSGLKRPLQAVSRSMAQSVPWPLT